MFVHCNYVCWFLLFIQIWNHVVVTLLKQMIQEYLSRSVSCKIWWAESTIFGGASSWSGRCSMTCPAVEDELAVSRPHFLK